MSIITVLGLSLDIIGAIFLSVSILSKSPFEIATEWRSFKSYDELLKKVYEKCRDFDYAAIGVSFLLVGFLFQIIGSLKFEININHARNIFLIIFGFYIYFIVALSNSYKNEAAIAVFLSIINYKIYKSSDANEYTINIPVNADISLDELLKTISYYILCRKFSLKTMSIDHLARDLYKEICKRYDNYELPQTVYSNNGKNGFVAKEHSLLYRALCEIFC